jgi:hypothetical protein
MVRKAIVLDGVVTNVVIGGDFGVELGDYQAVNAGDTWDGNTFTPLPPPAQTPEQIIAVLTAAVQSHLDDGARARGYDGILSAASYAGDAHPPFNIEGVAFRDWRGSVWAACYSIMADVQIGTRPVPTSDELIAALPTLSLA